VTGFRWWEAFVAWARRNGTAAHTLKAYRTYRQVFEDYLAPRGVDDPREADSRLIADFQAHLMTVVSRRGRPYSTSSRIHILGWVKKLYAFCLEEQRILTDPSRGVRLPRMRRRLPRSVLTAREMRQLLRTRSVLPPLMSRQGGACDESDA
jgi:site-specific recombinase XerD